MIMNSTGIPCRCAVYWKVNGSDSSPEVSIYAFSGLIRLNRTASLIWLLCDGHRREPQILQVLEDRFPGVPASRMGEELERFLNQAESRGLLIRNYDSLQPYRMIGERSLE